MIRLYSTRHLLQATALVKRCPGLLNRVHETGPKLSINYSDNSTNADNKKENKPANTGKTDVIKIKKKRALQAVVIGGTAVVAAPYALPALGFGAAGIVKGSTAATIMSMYGGTVPAEGIVATLQSASAGIGVASKISIFSTTSLSSYGIMDVVDRIKQKMRKNK